MSAGESERRNDNPQQILGEKIGYLGDIATTYSKLHTATQMAIEAELSAEKREEEAGIYRSKALESTLTYIDQLTKTGELSGQDLIDAVSATVHNYGDEYKAKKLDTDLDFSARLKPGVPIYHKGTVKVIAEAPEGQSNVSPHFRYDPEYDRSYLTWHIWTRASEGVEEMIADADPGIYHEFYVGKEEIEPRLNNDQDDAKRHGSWRFLEQAAEGYTTLGLVESAEACRHLAVDAAQNELEQGLHKDPISEISSNYTWAERNAKLLAYIHEHSPQEYQQLYDAWAVRSIAGLDNVQYLCRRFAVATADMTLHNAQVSDANLNKQNEAREEAFKALRDRGMVVLAMRVAREPQQANTG